MCSKDPFTWRGHEALSNVRDSFFTGNLLSNGQCKLINEAFAEVLRFVNCSCTRSKIDVLRWEL